jgi:hypothetical protein
MEWLEIEQSIEGEGLGGDMKLLKVVKKLSKSCQKVVKKVSKVDK